MTIVPDPPADIDIPIADRTIAAGEAEFPGALMGTSTDVLQGMQSGNSIVNTPIATPGAMIAAEAHPTNLAARAINARSRRVPPANRQTLWVCVQMSESSDDDEDEDDLSEGWRPKGGPDDHSKGKQKPTLPKTPTRDKDQPKQPLRDGASGTLSQSSKLGTSKDSHGQSATKAKAPRTKN
ncbi:hypothetical protein FKP32DRAFT_1676987 [Trametes sanguinea]|nr:hypothetical protein FKP32DRAFT_1676987 [Trametes sanguinea]